MDSIKSVDKSATIRMRTLTSRLLKKTFGLEKFLFLSSLIKYLTLSQRSKELQFVKILTVIKKDEGIILDVGAGQGLQTVSFAKEFPQCKIYSFDPIGYNVKVIEKQKIFYKLGNLKVFHKALGNMNDICELIVESETNCNDYNLVCKLENQENEIDTVHHSSSVNTLDSIDELKNQSLPLIAINLNLAKFEWAVLQGGLDIIKRDKPVIFCKLTDTYNKVITLSVLKQVGYIPIIIEQGRLDYYDSKIHLEDNFIFIHRSIKLDPLKEINLSLA